MTKQPVEKWPVTRRPATDRPTARVVLFFLRNLSGARFARIATRVASLLGRKMTYAYAQDTGLYSATDEAGTHYFGHSRRLWTVWDGLCQRGRVLGAQYLLDAVEFSDGDWIVDIGANTGDLSLHFLDRGVNVNAIAFEPSPQEFGALSANLEQNAAVISGKAHNLALWNEPNEGLTFYLKSAKADSSLLPVDNPTDKIQVPAERLDNVIERRPYKLLKLEAEGVEPEILEGASGVLDCFEYIAADVGFERGKEGGSTLPQVCNFLADHGFEIVGFNGRRYTVLFRRLETK